MKKLLLVLTLALLFSLVVCAGIAGAEPKVVENPDELSGSEDSALSSSSSSSNSSNGPHQDLALGGGKTATDIINVDAHSGPLGEDAFGHLRAKNNPEFPVVFHIEGDVTCLRVVGNEAVLGGELTRAEQEGVDLSRFHGFLQFVEDNKETGMPDRISFQFPLVNPPQACPPPNHAFNMFPLTQGNINVQDGQPK